MVEVDGAPEKDIRPFAFGKLMRDARVEEVFAGVLYICGVDVEEAQGFALLGMEGEFTLGACSRPGKLGRIGACSLPASRGRMKC